MDDMVYPVITTRIMVFQPHIPDLPYLRFYCLIIVFLPLMI